MLGPRGGGDAGGLEAVGEAAAGLAADLVAGAHVGWEGGREIEREGVCVCVVVLVAGVLFFARVRRCII